MINNRPKQPMLKGSAVEADSAAMMVVNVSCRGISTDMIIHNWREVAFPSTMA